MIPASSSPASAVPVAEIRASEAPVAPGASAASVGTASGPAAWHGRTALVTGGAGFIGSALVRRLVRAGARVVCFDALTYAGSRLNVAEVAALAGDDGQPRLAFVHADVRDRAAVDAALAAHRPSVVFHLAAESHVDRSIDGPAAFVDTNVVGTAVVLDAARAYHDGLDPAARAAFRLVHVSTDEVYGSLGPDDGAFTETTPYDPSSPYSASKAASDHLARAWQRTFGLPVLVTNCSNNYGPYQYPEKLIPVTILRALRGETIAVYGQGTNVRDWLFVDDHAAALCRVAEAGRPGETYNIGGGAERSNVDVVRAICARLDARRPRPDGTSHADAIAFVADRPGHDFRYAIDASKAARELGWTPATTFDDGLAATVDWYLDHLAWCDAVLDAATGTARIGTAQIGTAAAAAPQAGASPGASTGASPRPTA